MNHKIRQRICRRPVQALLAMLLFALTVGALAVPPAPDSFAPVAAAPASHSGIRFNLGRLNAEGLQGPPDGLRALHYEYCIPDRPGVIHAVSAIDPTLQIQRGSPGRINCASGELLCLGHTHQPDYRTVLERLTALPEIGEIREAVFE